MRQCGARSAPSLVMLFQGSCISSTTRQSTAFKFTANPRAMCVKKLDVTLEGWIHAVPLSRAVGAGSARANDSSPVPEGV